MSVFNASSDQAREYYECPALWKRDLLADGNYREKLQVFQRLIPADVRTVLDVGCGNGAITNALADTHRVTGLDRSAAALAHVRCPTVQSSCDDLPFAPAAFDLVLCSEVLEHLDNACLRATSAELRRVTRRYILLSVPDREDLALRMAMCPRCGHVAHAYNHLQRFDAQRLGRLFGDCDRVAVESCGAVLPPNWPPRLLQWRQQVLGVYWNAAPEQFPLCLQCGNRDFTPKHRGRDTLLRALTQLVYRTVTLGKTGGRDWIVLLLRVRLHV